jgi:hypothetical protein
MYFTDTQREEHKFQICKNIVLRRLADPKRNEVTGSFRIVYMHMHVLAHAHKDTE